MAQYRKESWEEQITQYEYERFEDESLKRQFQLLQTLGTSALSEQDLTNVRQILILNERDSKTKRNVLIVISNS